MWILQKPSWRRVHIPWVVLLKRCLGFTRIMQCLSGNFKYGSHMLIIRHEGLTLILYRARNHYRYHWRWLINTRSQNTQVQGDIIAGCGLNCRNMSEHTIILDLECGYIFHMEVLYSPQTFIGYRPSNCMVTPTIYPFIFGVGGLKIWILRNAY